MDHFQVMSAPIGISDDLSPEDRDKHVVLSEHMRVIPESEDYDEGFTLNTYNEDDDDFHIKHHQRFLKTHNAKMTMKGRDALSSHVEKHKVQKKEKEKIYG